MPRKSKKIAVLDLETDPFEHGANIQPFAAGFKTADKYVDFWGPDCIDRLVDYLSTLKDEYMIYAHNGGKFDFLFFLPRGYISNPALIINGRIVKCGLLHHELRDSLAIIPVALEKYKKTEIDYDKFKKNRREANKPEILSYLRDDCNGLFDLVVAFNSRFGPKLTVGSTAMAELGKFHTIIKQDAKHDSIYRPYYFGGRVEFFEAGRIDGDFKIYDVNSQYPGAMKNFVHPLGSQYIVMDGQHANFAIDRHTGQLKKFQGMYFIHFRGEHRGCLPTRIKGQSLSFESRVSEFHTTSHELIAGIELGLIKIHDVLSIRIPVSFTTFGEFVDAFMLEKVEGAKTGDKIKELFAKFILNSAYGKFATDPENFKEWFILDTKDDESIQAFNDWRALHGDAEPDQIFGIYQIWMAKAEVKERSYFDVAVAASITGAARSVLMRAIASCIRPLYCDTDSLICESLSGVEIDATKLGAWKFEGRTFSIAIAGKKMYACKLHNEDGTPMLDKKGKHKVKIASKGAKLTLEDVGKLCDGETVRWNSAAPNIKRDGTQQYISRNIKKRY